MNVPEILMTVATALGIRELIPLVFGIFFKRKEDVKSVEIDNSARMENGNREQIQFLKKQLAEAYSEIDKMQDIINGERGKIVELMKKLTDLELDMVRVEGEKNRLMLFACYDSDCQIRRAGVSHIKVSPTVL